MSKHTPGPWRYWSCRVDSRTGMEHYVQFANPKGHVFRAPLEYLREEDARLIAAAPELLEALKWYVQNDDVMEEMPGNEYWVEGLNKARAAIAKAEAQP